MMTMHRSIRMGLAAFVATTFVSACNTVPKEDPYVLYRELLPRSILVLPPVNESVDVNAPYSWVTTATMPIAEQGYYVFPVAVIDAFMKENGLPNPEDMHAAPLDKISEIIGADAILYVTLEEFGQKFELLNSVTRVHARAEMLDVKSAQVIWTGNLNYEKANDNGGQGVLGALVSAAITQIGQTIMDGSHDAAILANDQLFKNKRNGLLLGPRHPGYAEQVAAAEAAALKAEQQAVAAEASGEDETRADP